MQTVEIVEHNEEISVIGVIADTHIPLRAARMPAAVFSAFEEAELILCAGDLVTEEVLKELESISPVEAVAGNMDPHSLRQKLCRLKIVRVGGLSIGLVHGDQAGRQFSAARLKDLFAPHRPEVIVFGHLHQPFNRREEGVLYFNPGSPVDPRWGARASIGKLNLQEGEARGEIIYLP